MEDLHGWAIDLESVYGSDWDKKGELQAGVDYCLWESPDGSTAGLLYDIVEVGLSKEAGSLAVFLNKADPELLFNHPDLRCWYLYGSGVQFGGHGLIFVHRFTYGKARLGAKVCALDLSARRFALVDPLPEDFYDISPADGENYRFKRTTHDGSVEEVLVDLGKQRWRPLSPWANLHPDVPMPERALYALTAWLRRFWAAAR